MKKILAIILLLPLGNSLSAQATKASQDAGLWATVNAEKKLSDRWAIFLTEEFRLRNNFSRINLFYTDIGAEFTAAKPLRIALSYRNVQKNNIDGSYGFRHRFSLDITLKKKYSIFLLAYRQRIQREVTNRWTSENGHLPEWYSRNKFTVKFDLDKPATPYIAAEFRYQINDPRSVESDGTWHRMRYIAGLDYKLTDISALGLYYLVQYEWNVKTPQSIYIVGLEYNIKI